MTIKIKPETKALMEIYGANITADTGNSPTNDDIIKDMAIKLLPQEQVQQIMDKRKKAEQKKNQ